MTESGYRVATWNLWGRLGDDPAARQPAIREALRAADPDVVGLQEICADDAADDAATLAGDLGYEFTWVKASPGNPSGNAILSRWPVIAARTWPLPADAEESEGSRDRVLLLAEIETPAGLLPFFTTHLTWYPASSANRCDQVREIARVVAGQVSERADGRLPPVVVGDLNARPEADEVRLLEGLLTPPARPGLVLTDAWRWSDDPHGGETRHPRNPYVAATGEPPGRLDYVLCAAPRADGAGRVGRAKLFGDRPAAGGVWGSDHAGVLVDLTGPSATS